MEVTVTYLEMQSCDQIVPADPGRVDPSMGVPQIWRSEIPVPELNRFFYTAVGGPWRWIDRLPWSYERWTNYLCGAGVETWIGSVRGTPFGYCELERAVDGPVEIAYFGLLPAFVGRGLGGTFLTGILRRAWHAGPAATTRVGLNTCSTDGPAALANYLARGFRICGTRTELRDLPDVPPGPWPGAYSGNTPVER